MSNTYTDSSGRMRNEATAPDTAIDAQGNRINIDENAHKSDSIVGSVVEAAKAAGQRVKEAFTGPSEPQPAMGSDYAGIKEDARDTSHSMKESARDAKGNLMDTADDAKAKARDARTSIKESLGMDTTGDRVKDFGANAKDRMGTAGEKAKDRLQNVNERAENIGYDAKDRLNDNSTGSTFQDVKEKVKDTVDAGTEKIKQAFSRTGENTEINTYPASGSSGSTQYHTEDAKSKIASAGVKVADKTEDLAGSAKDKLSSGMGYSNDDWTTNAKANLYDKADKVQDWAADQKHKANADANIHEKNKQAIRNTGFNPVDPQI